jgi:hypothetical protein
MSHWNRIVLSSSLIVSACFNPDPGGAATEGGTSSSADGSSTGITTSATTQSGTGQMSADASSGDATTMMVDPTTAGPTTTDGPDDTTSTSSSSSSGEESSSTGEPVCPTVGPAGLPGVNPQAIWIANSTQGTISKIDTATMIEEGRFATRADNNGNPSRTSVSLDGDVAVANRSGGLTKFYGDLADCVDADGDGVITTSSGAMDVLPWAEEECRAWFLGLNYTSQRPVAWTTGTLDEDACEHVGERVWTAGVIADTTIEVLRVDGDTGVVEDSVTIPGLAPNFYGLYGGAVDSEGNFWASMLGQASLVRVDGAAFTYETWLMPTSGYGMTVGASGYVFTCSSSVARFDPATELWQVANGVGGSGGCAEDGNGTLWLANDPLVALDVNTLTVIETIDLPGYVHGVSVDFDGYVWGAAIYDNQAYRVDPVAYTIDTVPGLDYPYTYSDMTGFSLASVAP